MRLGHCLAKGLCHIFLGWVEPPAWTELYSEVLFSASFNPSLFRSLKSFYLPQPPPTPIPTFSQTHLFFYIFISSTLIPCFPACDNTTVHSWLFCQWPNLLGIRGLGYRVTQSDWKCYKMQISRRSFLESVLKNCTRVFGREEERFCLQSAQYKTLRLKSLLNCSTTRIHQEFDIKKQTRSWSSILDGWGHGGFYNGRKRRVMYWRQLRDPKYIKGARARARVCVYVCVCRCL